MTTPEILDQLKAYGNENTKKIYLKHGAREPFYGVKVQDLKKIVRKLKKVENKHELSLELYATGNSDAMYLAGLIADENKISKTTLHQWAAEAYWYMLSEYTVAWVAAETPFGFELGLEWIASSEEGIAAAGWATLASYAALKPDAELDIEAYSALLDRVAAEVHGAQNRVSYVMNGFVIAVGTYIESLTEKATAVATQIGKVTVNMGGTACKVPLAATYIQKVIDKGRVGKKRKTARC